MVYGDREAQDIARKTVSSLDIPTPKGKGGVHLITLSNAKAVDLATVINTLVERQVGTSGEGQKADIVLSKDVKVVADPATNSLLITARPDEFDALRAIIEKLDKVRKQVFIEALIMEVNTEAQINLGLSWMGAGQHNDITGLGGVKPQRQRVFVLGGDRMASLPGGASLGFILSDVFSIGGSLYNIQSIINLTKTILMCMFFPLRSC